MYAPDVGEVVEAKRGPSDRWTRAVVVRAYRNREGNLKVKVQWLEDDPTAGVGDHGRPRKPIVALSHSYMVIKEGEPPLVRQINEGSRPATPPTGKAAPS